MRGAGLAGVAQVLDVALHVGPVEEECSVVERAVRSLVDRVQRFQDGLARARRDDDSPAVEEDEAVMEAEAVLHSPVLLPELCRQAAASASQRGPEGLVLGILLGVLGEELFVRSRGIEGDEGRPLVALVEVGRGGGAKAAASGALLSLAT